MYNPNRPLTQEEAEHHFLVFNFSDSAFGNAGRIKELHGDKRRCSYHKCCWYFRAEDGAWIPDRRDEAVNLARDAMQQFAVATDAQELWRYYGPREVRQMEKFAEPSQTLPALNRALRCLQLDLAAPDDFGPGKVEVAA